MKTISSLILTGLLSFLLLAPATAAIETIKVGPQTYSVCRIDPKTQELGLYWKDPSGKIYGSFNRLISGLKKQGRRVDFATNAGIFEEGFIPSGLLMIGGQDILPLNLNPGQGNFFLQPNGIFLLSKGKPYLMTSDAWLRFKHRIDFATQSGPMLVINDKIHQAFTPGSTSRFVRSGVGIDKNNRIVFALSRQPVNFHDFAAFFRDELACRNALYLDGTISKFYSPRNTRLPEARESFAAFFAVTSPL